jgi:hypothetical protein
MRWIATTLLLTACTIPDGIGYRMPPECADLSTVNRQPTYVSAAGMLALEDRAHKHCANDPCWGVTVRLTKQIYVLNYLTPAQQQSVVAHERCHILVLRLTGKDWIHPPEPSVN